MIRLGITEIIILAFILFVLITIAAAVVYLLIRGKQQPAGRVQCPYCAEWIQPDAKVCRFCGREITPPNQ